jgi:phosphatidylglycerol:prolipoprotein diacylglycerol transferase
MIFLEIPWNVSPIIAKLGNFELRWYGLLFASGFLLGYQIMLYIFKQEHKPEKDLDALLITMILSTVIGARFGHYFFYEFEHFKENPTQFLIDMILPPYQGLASHGATIGILTGLYLYSRKRKDQPFLWVTDRVVITVALAGCFIRLGNLMNHEIVGKETNLPWGFRFNDFRMGADGKLIMTPEAIVRHPAQLYEALSCLVLCVILFFIWKKMKEKLPHGLLLGIFLIWVFTLRFFYEFLKENQEAFEDKMTFNMGQILSIPAILLGIGVLFYALTKGKKDAEKMLLWQENNQKTK